MKYGGYITLLLVLLILSSCSSERDQLITNSDNSESLVLEFAQEENSVSAQEIEAFLGLLSPVLQRDADTSIFTDNWKPAYNIMSLEILNFIGNRNTVDALLEKMIESTGQDFGYDTNDWYSYFWNQEEYKFDNYGLFKSELYKQIDPKFDEYFKEREETVLIRLDEVRWGGVVQDGIPPLRGPDMITASEAEYLDDDDVIFGIEVNGDVRAYPKRILAWHEMFVDTVGGVPVAGVYCTLCGTVILYETEFEGVNYEIGTSGFLYRSNKLMYDRATQSLWNTLKGEPVIGPLVDQGIQLQHRSVVTTTWGEWKDRHPDTQVLSLDTGFSRDYGEGVAYNEYFSTDQLMFHTPFDDARLENKQEVLALRFPAHPTQQLAIDTDFLNENTIYYDVIGEQKFVVITDRSGANRVYEAGDVVFESYDGVSSLTDDQGNTWTVSESELNSGENTLERLPYHRAFWFGWHAAFPESRLVK